MKYDLSHYRTTPVGEQLNEHFKKRALVRSQSPLLSFSVKSLAKKFEFNSKDANRDDMPHAAA